MLTYITDDVQEGAWGGEKNDGVLLNVCKKHIDDDLIAVRSSYLHEHGVSFLHDREKGGFIVASFIFIPPECRRYLMDNGNYVIYEHEHKYSAINNPAGYKNYKIPANQLQHVDFYKRAKVVFCQSNEHALAVKANIPEATVVNVSGNLWASSHLDNLQKLIGRTKKKYVGIYMNDHPYKNMEFNKQFCTERNWSYTLIGNLSEASFTDALSQCSAFVFFPRWLETLNRVSVECRMLGVPVITNEFLGAAGEPWFSLEGEDLIDVMRTKRKEIPKQIVDLLKE